MTNFNIFKKLFILLLFIIILNVFDTNSLLYIIFIRQYNSKSKTKYTFTNREYPLIYFKNKNLTLDISEIVNKFISDNKKFFDKYISVICQIRNAGDTYYSIGDRFPIDINNPADINAYKDYLQAKLNILDGRYEPEVAISVNFNYTNTNQKEYSIKENLLKISQFKSNHDFKNDVPLNLPLNTDYLTWGSTLENINSNTTKISNLYIDINTKINRYIEVTFLSKIDTAIKVYIHNKKLNIVNFVDKIINKYNEFIRIVGNKIYHIKNNKLYFIYEKLFVKQFIGKLKPTKNFDFNILTIDVETFKDDKNNLNIYCISIFNGDKAKSFYLSDYNNIDLLVKDFLSSLFKRENNGKNIYIHNSSEFDMILLYKYIVNFDNVTVKPIIKDGKFINLQVNFGIYKGYTLNFKDSILLLPQSLSKLSKSFNDNFIKDMFPHKFVNKNNLNYIGNVPPFEFFYNITLEEYNNYKSRFTKNNWSLKNEAIKYCELDCKSLYEVLKNFAKFIFKDFKINITTTPTLPSAAFKIFRTVFISEKTQIATINGKMFDDINNAFYGGHVDMYIPRNKSGELIYHYDVNSLYPYSMKSYKYPISYFGYFKGDIRYMNDYVNFYNDNTKYVGFYKVIVNAPSGLLHPILPHKVNGVTVYGEGSWTGWYFSEELLNAEKFGYSFEILEGYLFNSANIFSSYIEKFYKIKEQAAKDSPDYLIGKLFQNSLFGKFAMSRFLINYDVVNKNKVSEFISSVGFENFVTKLDIGNKCIVAYRLNFQNHLKINIAIGSAISAYSRIYMSMFKNNPDFKLFYTDTDSYFFNKPLPVEFVDNKKLGLFKLENVLTDFVAVGPKVYGGKSVDGTEFTKVKGFKNNLPFDDLVKLLNVNTPSIQLKQEKMVNSLAKGNIHINDSSTYNLKPTDNKRNLIYKNGILVGTSNKVIVNI